MEMQSKTRVELRLKVKILFKMSNWEKDSGWSRKKNRLITLGHHTSVLPVLGTIYKLVLTSVGFGRTVESILSRVNVEGQFFLLQVHNKFSVGCTIAQ